MRGLVSASCFIILAFPRPLAASQPPPEGQEFVGTTRAGIPVSALWRDRGNIESLDLTYGAGGKEHQPAGNFTFVKEDKNGTSPKFDVIDDQGVRWKVKLGQESKAETAATRLVWAAGYFTDEDYYLPELRVQKMARLKRGRQFVSDDGLVHGVRLERNVKGQKKDGNWTWYQNPFSTSKELNGLKVMMALINNWDLKEVNNAIYREKDDEPHYVVSDLGASFGRTGNTLTRSKGNLRDYRGTKFIQRVTSEEVDFVMRSRPFFLTIFDVPNYIRRTKMQDIVKNIPRTDAKWIGTILGQLSANQIRDCFRAAGFSPEESEGFTTVVQGRIAELNRL